MIFRVFGRLEVRDRTGEVIAITGRKQRTLLMALLVHVNEWMTTRWLVDVLWGSNPPRSATANLKTFVWTLRQHLPAPPDGERIEARRGGYRIVAGPDELDLLAITDLLAAGRKCAANGQTVKAGELFGKAASLWRGHLPEDLVDTPLLAADRNRLAEERRRLFEEWFDVRLRSGQHTDVVSDIPKVLAEQPLRERLWAQHMLALYRSGRRAEALAAYQEVYALLDRELGIGPGRELQQLQRDILRDDPALSVAEPTEDQHTSAPVPAQLPAGLVSFTGRDQELAHLLSLVVDEREPAQARATVCAVDGMAGIGKTALAVHAAHQLTPRFPDGQLFLDMHGFTQGVKPMTANDALDRILRSLGTPADAIPRHLEDRAALYRSRLAGHRVLVLLDNVADEQQVLPLVPAAPGCLVLITGRRRLSGIDDVRSVSLDVLPVPDATRLFSQIVGPQRTRWEQDLTAELVELCGRLPLAIRVAAARLNARPTWTIGHLADRLRDRQHRLTELEAGQRSVVAVLQVSYQHLNGDLQRVFRLLGLHPGMDLCADTAAALTDLSPRHAERALEALVDVHLLQPAGGQRYRLHDLVRQHAAAAAEAEEPIESRRGALRQLLDYWIRVGTAAADTVNPHRAKVEFPVPPAPATPTRSFATAAEATDWFVAERRNLVAGITYAARHRLHEYTWHLVHPLRALFPLCGYFDDWLQVADLAVVAARELGTGDPVADGERLAVALRNASHASMTIGHHPAALRQLEEAVEILTATGDRYGAAITGTNMAYLAFRMGRCAEFLERQRAALELFVERGDRWAEVAARGMLGLFLWRLGRYGEALDQERRALALSYQLNDADTTADQHAFAALVHARLGHYEEAAHAAQRAQSGYEVVKNKLGQTYALNTLATVRLRQGRYAEATEHLTQALTIIRAAGERFTEGRTLHLLGIVQRSLGRAAEAKQDQENALDLARDIGDPALESEALVELGIGCGDADDWSRALSLHQHALTLAEAVSDPYLQAVAHREIARARDALGDRPAARRHRTEAATRFRELAVPEAGED
jgi:DNA-binding SARP family transcriptional activator